MGAIGPWGCADRSSPATSGSAGGTGVVRFGAPAAELLAGRLVTGTRALGLSDGPASKSVAGVGVMAGLTILPVDPVDPGLMKVGGNGHANGGKEAMIADRIVDPVAA